MFAILALVLYNVQWLGIVLGVGAEVVLMAAHLSNLHHRKPQWLEHVPAVRVAQGTGLALIIVSGLGAVGYHVALGATAALAIPTFGFKWILIAAVTVSFMLERHIARGRAALEGFAGGTWYALFMVHSIAPVLAWLDLSALYIAWLIVFGVLWALAIGAMRLSAKSAPAFVVAAAPAPVTTKIVPAPKPIEPQKHIEVPKPVAVVPPPASKPVEMPKPQPTPQPVVVAKPVPVVAAPVVAAAPTPEAVVTPVPKNMSLWQWLMAHIMRNKPKTAPAVVAIAPTPASAPKPVEVPESAPPLAPMAAASAPIPTLTTTNTPLKTPVTPKPTQPAPVVAQPAAPAAKPGLPAIEPLELVAPKVVAAAPAAPTEKPYVPDWAHLPGLRVMPQRAEDLHLHNRAPVVQLA